MTTRKDGIEDALADTPAKPAKAEQGTRPAKPSKPEQPAKPAKAEQGTKPAKPGKHVDPDVAARIEAIEAEIAKLGDPQVALASAVAKYRKAHADKETSAKLHEKLLSDANLARRRAEAVASRDLDRLRVLREQLAALGA